MQVTTTAQYSLPLEHSHPIEHAAQSTPHHNPFDEFLADTRRCFPSLTVTSHAGSDGHWALIESSTTTSSPLESKMPTRNARVIVHAPCEDPSHISYKFEAHFVLLFQGLVTDIEFGVLLQSLLPGSNYRLCPGLPQQLRESVDFESKSTRKWGFPCQRTDHVNCQLWFPAKITPRLQQESTCSKCINLAKYLRRKLKTRALVTPTRKANRVRPSSRCPLKYLSPATRRLRQRRARKERACTKKKLDKYRRYDINVGEATHGELIQLVSAIQNKSQGEVEALLAEADSAGKGNIIRQKWQQDVQEHLSFHKDQRQNSKCCLAHLLALSSQ